MELLRDDIDFSAYMQETDAKQKLKPAKIWINELVDRLYTPKKQDRAVLPWPKTHALIQFRPGEVTLWGGANGAGKSLVTGMVGVSLCAQDLKVCIASFEMKPMKTVERMSRQFSGTNANHPAYAGSREAMDTLAEQYREFSAWSDGKLWLYDQQGTVNAKQVCAAIRYFAIKLGGNHFFVDSLMKCVAGEDDYNGQKAFVDELTAIARDHQVHIHLIHHIRKPANEDHKPNKYDYKGTGAITDQVDNVISVWRDKAKEKAKEAGKQINEATQPDALLICDKQRNGEWEGTIGLWFDRDSQQYVAHHGDEPLRMNHHPEEP